jgi:hypothetical protein
MIAANQWTELLTCPNCGIAGTAHFSQPENRVFDSTWTPSHRNSKSFAWNLARHFSVRPAINLRVPDSAKARPPTEVALLRRPQTGRGKPLNYVRTDFVVPSFS